jgi:hypothetical protein
MGRTPKVGDIVWFGLAEGKDEQQRDLPKAKPAVVVEVYEPGNPTSLLSDVVFSSRGPAMCQPEVRYSATLACESWTWPS